MSSYVFISLKKSGHWITWKLYVLLQSHWDGMFLQFSSVAQLCLTLCDAMNRSHLILCRPLLLLPPNPSQHQGLFQWVNSSHEVAKVCSLGYHNWELVHLDFFFNPKIFLLPCTFLCNKVKNVWNYLFRLITWYLLPNV